MADITLKKCPFCGGKAILGRVPYKGWFRVMCAGCCASSAKYITEERAAEAWNSRITGQEWISVAEHGNPTEYTHAWVYTEDGAIDEDSFYPHDVGAEYSSSYFEGYRVSDGWYNSGTNDDGKRVIYYMPIPDPEPPAPPKGV